MNRKDELDKQFALAQAIQSAGKTSSTGKMSTVKRQPTAGTIIPCGDWVAVIAKRIGAARLAKWWSEKTGIDCGCEDRQKAMNDACAKLEKWLWWLKR
jgi:hypothetical protein